MLKITEINKYQNFIFYISLILFEGILLIGLRVDQWPGIFILPIFFSIIYVVYHNNLDIIKSLLSKKVLWILLLIQTFGWVITILIEYYSISYNLFDTGIFAHVIINFSRGNFFNYILQMPSLSDHFTPNLFLLSPFFSIAQSILWLPFFRLLAYLICIPIIWHISSYYIKNIEYRYFVIILWLINYPLLKVLNFEVQPSFLSLPFILLTFLLWKKHQYILSILCLIFIPGFKEHLALVWLSVGVWLYLFENKKFVGSLLFTIGIIYGLAIVFLIIPAITGVSTHQLVKFGPFEIISLKIKFFFLIMFSLGLLPIIGWRIIIFILPSFAISFVSKSPEMASLSYHYQDLPVTISFVGLILAISQLENREAWIFKVNHKIQKISLVISLGGLIIFNNHYPGRSIRNNWPTKNDLAIIKSINHIKGELDSNRVFWCIDSLGVYFIDKPKLRSISTLEEVLNETQHHYVIIADNINNWPFNNEDYSKLKGNLHKLVLTKKYEKMENLYPLLIYKSL